jgi:hypothetical protein
MDAATAQTFHLLPLLPLEIKEQIWTLAIRARTV